MIVPITINMSPLIQEFSLSKEQTEDILDGVVKEVTARFAQTLEHIVEQNLGSTRKAFVNAIKVVDTGRLMGRVLIDYSGNKLIEKIEEGSPSFDMKPGLLASPKAKVTKDGTRYITVPMSWGTPGSTGENSSSIMPDNIYEQAKKLESNRYLDLNSLPKNFQELQSRKEIKTESKLFEKYLHKNSIYEGLTKFTDEKTGQNSYTTFRRVSGKSSSKAWIHPGFIKRDFMDKALSSIDIPSLAGRVLDQKLEELGF